MKILGLIGSYRKLGNTEVLVKEALMEAQRLGAEVGMLRLTDLRIEPCKGCMACVFRQEECRIPDDWCALRERLVENDAVILGAPTYLLGSAGIIKMISDRNIAFQFGNLQHSGKPGAIIGLSGVKGWEPFALPMLNVFMLTCGFKIIDQVMFYAQGPGEVLLDESAMKRARKVGTNVFKVASKPAEKRNYVGEPGVCPVCHQNLFTIKNGTLECALCQAEAEFKRLNGKTKLIFDQDSLKDHRWSEEALFEHFSLAVLPSEPRFLKNRDKIKNRTLKYRSFLTKKNRER